MRSQCNNCGWKGVPKIELLDIPDLAERLDEGGVVPSGECPECGALCCPIVKTKRPVVRIDVHGGVAYCNNPPKGVTVKIYDHDNHLFTVNKQQKESYANTTTNHPSRDV